MSYLQCPDCKLTVPAAAYYVRGDRCPRCLTEMVPSEGRRRAAPPVAVSAERPSETPAPPPS